MTKTIEIVIARTGQTRVETKGFAGSECQTASRFLEQSLGAVCEKQFTPEFYSAQNSQSQRERNSTG
jgi:hypothetical protein